MTCVHGIRYGISLWQAHKKGKKAKFGHMTLTTSINAYYYDHRICTPAGGDDLAENKHPASRARSIFGGLKIVEDE